MHREKIFIELDREIARLQQVRELLSADASPAPRVEGKRKPGRKAGTSTLSIEARKRIARSMKKSWAARKKAAALEKK